MSDSKILRRISLLLPALGGFLGIFGSAIPAEARRVEASQAPAAWVAYAQTVSEAVQTRLEADDPVAVRLRAYLDQLPGAVDAEGISLNLAFWIDGDGRITRIDHAPFAQMEPNSDLNALMVGMTLQHPPPKGMLIPLRFTIHLKPAPSAAPSDAPVVTGTK